MNRQLILVRHSVPEISEDLPAREWGLSEDGRRQAERMAEHLLQGQPDIVATSPEPKARETAEILAGRVQLSVQVIAELHEHERGAVPHLSKQEFETVVREFFEKPDTLVFGNETADQAHERFSRAVNSILSENDNSKICIVAHGIVISLFVSRLTRQPGFPFWSQLGLPSLTVLDLQSKKLIALENIASQTALRRLVWQEFQVLILKPAQVLKTEESKMEPIDLRSDTVTKPTPEMREAMAEAEVGDDVFRDDPTVIRLEEMAAGMVRKEAALFVPSGTMGNLIALLVHCQRGEEAIVGSLSHIYLNEAGGMAALGGIQPCPVQNQKDGTLALDDIFASIRTEDVHHPITRLICLENTQNICGGIPLTPDYTRQVGELARQHGLHLHVDGARIFNSAAAQNVSVRDLVDPADSVMFCLSKGLAAPVGSILAGSQRFVNRARHVRKMLGGGMRQAGVLAAAGIISLEKMTKRLGDDHLRAKKLADGLRQNPGVILDPGSPYTNMIYFNLADHINENAQTVTEKMKDHGVLLDPDGSRRFRLVTHYWIDDEAVERTINAFGQVLN